jgi:hypothetical protein
VSDEDLRALERAAELGLPGAQERLVAARLRTIDPRLEVDRLARLMPRLFIDNAIVNAATLSAVRHEGLTGDRALVRVIEHLVLVIESMADEARALRDSMATVVYLGDGTSMVHVPRAASQAAPEAPPQIQG